jgi:hypothetical protein
MKEIEFRDSDKRQVKLSIPAGGSDSYHIYIDKFYYGNLVYHKGKWIGHLNDNDLTMDDIQILGELVKENT